MGLDLNKMKKRKEDLQSSTGAYWKPKEGKNTIRIFMFEHKVTSEDTKAGLFPKDQIGKTVTEMDRVVVRHFGIDPDNRPVFSTPSLVERYKKLRNQDEEAAKAIRPSKAFFMNVVDTSVPEKIMMLYGPGPTVYDAILNYIIDPEYGEDLLGCNGRDFVINYDSKSKGAKMYSVGLRKEGKSEKLPSDLEDSVLDLYSEEAYSQMGKVADDIAEIAEIVEEELEKIKEDEDKSKKDKTESDDIFSDEDDEDDEEDNDEDNEEDNDEDDDEDDDGDKKAPKVSKPVVKKKKKK